LIPAVYILASIRQGTLTVGSTTVLRRRIQDHRSAPGSAFSRKFGVQRLVYYEFHASPRAARTRESQLRRSARKLKLELIDRLNPTWRDLYGDLDQRC
jgi:putative endonuclease